MDDAEDTQALGQPVDEPLADETEAAEENGTWGGKASSEDDGVLSFDDEDSEEVEATLGDDSYSADEAVEDGEGPQ